MKMHISVTLAAFSLLSAAAAAQDPPKTFVEARGNVRPVPLPPGGAPPRMADGKSICQASGSPAPRGKPTRGVSYRMSRSSRTRCHTGRRR